MFSLFFIKRPIFAKVISIVISIVGLIAIYVLPIAQFPNMNPGSLFVTANYVGGTPEDVEKYVTTPLEQQIVGVPGMLYMLSNSSSNGQSQIQVYFEPGYDMTTAIANVQNRIQMAMPQLPQVTTKSGVSTLEQQPNILGIVTLTSTNPEHDQLFLSNYAQINILNPLKSLAGVGNAQIFGQRQYSMRFWLDINKMTALNIAVTDVTNALSDQNIDAAPGQIGAPPMPSTNKKFIIIDVKSRLDKVEDFANIVVRSNDDGTLVRMKDISRVEQGSQLYNWNASLNNKNAALVGIFQLPSGNSLAIKKAINAKLEELSHRFPEGLKAELTYDTTNFIKVSIDEVVQTLFEALILVVIVTYVFLQNWRATLIPTIAIPVSLVGTFFLMLTFDFSINTLTLFGLILAIGLVVDDGIIVVENVERIFSENPDVSAAEATKQAMIQVSAPIIATTLVLFAVFIPVAFIPGVSGSLYQQFALTITMAVAISALNALTLSPALAATLLRHKRLDEKDPWFFRKFNEGFDAFKDKYIKLLDFGIRHWYVPVFLFLAGLGLTYMLFKILPSGFIPEEDQGTFFVIGKMDAGSSLEANQKVTTQAAEIIKNIDGIKDVIYVTGYSILSQSVDTSMTTFFVVMENWDKRTAANLGVNDIMQAVREKTAHLDKSMFIPFNQPSIPGMSPIGGFQMQVNDYLSGDLSTFYKYIEKIMAEANKDPRIMYADAAFTMDYPYVYVDINRDKVKSLNLDLGDVFTTMQGYMGSYFVNLYNKYGMIWQVNIQADMKYRDQVSDIGNMYVKNTKGEMVPFSAFASVKRTNGPTNVTHFNTYRSISINGVHNAYGGYSSGDAIKAMEEICDRVLPKEYGYQWYGTALQEIQAGGAAIYIFMLSLLFVFLFLSAQYESWVLPVMIMVPIPVVMLGALGFSFFFDPMNNTYTQIGMVMLIGLSSKNAILVVEFAKELHDQGMAIKEAAIEAARQRVRPILMTIFAFLLGVTPLMFAEGAGANARHSIGFTVFGGMAMSTVLTLLFTPLLYVYLEKFRERNNKGKTDAPKEVSHEALS